MTFFETTNYLMDIFIRYFAMFGVIYALFRVLRHPRAGDRLVVMENLRDFCFVGVNLALLGCYLLFLKQPYHRTHEEIAIFVIVNLIPFLIVAGIFAYRFRYAADSSDIPTVRQMLAATGFLILFTCFQVFAYMV